MVDQHVHHYLHLPFNMYFTLMFLLGCFALLNTLSLQTAGAFMSWALLFGLLQEHINHHPDGKVAQLLERF